MNSPPSRSSHPPYIGRDKTVSRRSQSFSSSLSHSSNSSFGSVHSFHDGHSPISPSTPLHFKGVPFSWEKIPGIPKQLYASHEMNEDPSLRQRLPLPPAGGCSNSIKKMSFRDEFPAGKPAGSSFREDPFFTALVECSKEDRQISSERKSGSKVGTKSLSDRLGLMGFYAMNTCKTTSAVSDSTVHLKRSRNYYDLLNRRSRR